MTKSILPVVLLALFLSSGVQANPGASIRLPVAEDLCIGAWFLGTDALSWPQSKRYLDHFAQHSPYNLLSTSFRWAPELTDPEVHALAEKIIPYAHAQGLKISLDLDIRLARRAFEARYPEEQQGMIRFVQADLEAGKTTELTITPKPLQDHMTGNTIAYIPLSGRVEKVFSWLPGEGGIEAGSLQDITESCRVLKADKEGVRVAIPGSEGRKACVAAIFTHLTPALFAPHFDAFQRELVEAYADLPLDGLMKDEWGLPPYSHSEIHEHKDFWYSPWLAEAYAAQSEGREYLLDCLLMYVGEAGREAERQAAINRLHRIKYARNVAIENTYYELAKEFFGPEAHVTTHPTWVADPRATEYKKHGLDWWAARRDFAQTDEGAPWSVRSALAKKWPGRSACYNQYYSTNYSDYVIEFWRSAASANRINYHPIYPNKTGLPRSSRYSALMAGGLMRGESRLRLVSLITQAPLHCPVAVLFGHACAGNWAGPGYDDPGLKVAEACWEEGRYTDLIPTTEIENKSLRLNSEGAICYGPQIYDAVLLYQPEFESAATAAFFREAAQGPTRLFRLGDWTRDPEAQPFDGAKALPESMTLCTDSEAAAHALHNTVHGLRSCPAPKGVPPLSGWHYRTDGTIVYTAGSLEAPEGAPIPHSVNNGVCHLKVDAVGVFAIRLSPEGRLEALAAGELRRLSGPAGLDLELPGVDLAFWRDASGAGHGVLQGHDGPIPEALLSLCDDWRRIQVPLPAW